MAGADACCFLAEKLSADVPSHYPSSILLLKERLPQEGGGGKGAEPQMEKPESLNHHARKGHPRNSCIGQSVTEA